MPTETLNQPTIYIARYGQTAWAKALAAADRHRRRAFADYHLTEHWTAPEWLDLCGAWDMRCSLQIIEECALEGPLTPHHRLDLSRGGSNLIDNILPVCPACHAWVGIPSVVSVDCRVGWLEWQRGLCETVQVGDEVFDKVYQCRDHPDIVTVKAILPPVPWDDSPEIDKLNEHERKEGGLVIDGGKATHWQNALILTEADGLEGFSRNLEDMEVYTYDAWEAFLVRQAVSDRAREERTGVRRRRKEQRQARDAE